MFSATPLTVGHGLSLCCLRPPYVFLTTSPSIRGSERVGCRHIPQGLIGIVGQSGISVYQYWRQFALEDQAIGRSQVAVARMHAPVDRDESLNLKAIQRGIHGLIADAAAFVEDSTITFGYSMQELARTNDVGALAETKSSANDVEQHEQLWVRQ